MSIRVRIVLLLLLSFVATAVVGGFAIRQVRQSTVTLRNLTDRVVPSALATADLVSAIKDVQLTAIAMVSAEDKSTAEQAATKLKALETWIRKEIDSQAQSADNDTQRGLISQIQESLKNYFKSIDDTSKFMLAGQQDMATAVLYANVAEYQKELGAIVETLRIEKNRGKDAAIADLVTSVDRNGATILTVAIVILGLQAGVGALLYRRIHQPLRRILDEVATIRSSLNLAHRIPRLGAPEIDRVADGFNGLLDEFQAIVRGVQDTGRQVSGRAEELATASADLLAAIEQQNEATARMAASVQEMATGVAHVSQSSGTAQDIARNSLVEASEGATAIEKSVEEIVVIVQSVKTSSDAMSALSEHTGQIGGIATTIKEIADQTNLLALNAAIEAARAGEQGRGFAVVADEVRKLAERTTLATHEIAGEIQAVQQEVEALVVAMRNVAERAHLNADEARRAGRFIKQIRQSSTQVVEVAADMVAALRNQNSETEQFAVQLERISTMSDTNSSSMGEAKEVSDELKRLSAGMHQLVVRFQV